MSEPTPEATPQTDPAAQPNGEPAPSNEPKPAPEDKTDWKAEARKWEQRAKENNQKANEFDKQRKAAMTDAERAAAEAEERGRTAATSEFGKRLARSEFDALAGRRNADFDTASTFEWLDLAKFVGEDGEPDTKAIQAAVERLVPEPAGGPPSFDGGSRTPSPAPQGMNGLIRKATGRA